MVNVFYVPSYSPKKSIGITSLEKRLKEVTPYENWHSMPQATEKFDFQNYLILLQTQLNQFLSKYPPESTRIIGSSFGGGILHYLMGEMNFSSKVLLFKPCIFSKASEAFRRFDPSFVPELPEYQKICNASPNNSEVQYVLGSNDSVVGDPKLLFEDWNNSKLLILENSPHFSRKDEFPEFQDFYGKFIEN